MPHQRNNKLSYQANRSSKNAPCDRAIQKVHKGERDPGPAAVAFFHWQVRLRPPARGPPLSVPFLLLLDAATSQQSRYGRVRPVQLAAVQKPTALYMWHERSLSSFCYSGAWHRGLVCRLPRAPSRVGLPSPRPLRPQDPRLKPAAVFAERKPAFAAGLRDLPKCSVRGGTAPCPSHTRRLQCPGGESLQAPAPRPRI